MRRRAGLRVELQVPSHQLDQPIMEWLMVGMASQLMVGIASQRIASPTPRSKSKWFKGEHVNNMKVFANKIVTSPKIQWDWAGGSGRGRERG